MSSESKQKSASVDNQSVTESPGLFDQVLAATQQTAPPDRVEDMVRAFVEQANHGQLSFDKNIIHSIRRGIAAIDEIVSRQLAEVMHHERFQKLEGSWRGLHYLCKNSTTGAMLKIKVLPCSKRELAKSLSSADRYDDSSVWRAIYEDEFGTAGGQPYGALIGDYEFENHPEDIKLLEDMSGIAAGSFAPFITAPSPKLFGLRNWRELNRLKKLETTFDGIEYAKWKAFRDHPDSRYVVMTMPRTLARYPYGKNTKRVDAFDFEELPLNAAGESVEVPYDQYCWMNSAYAYASKLTAAFHETRWCTRIRGRNSGGAVEGLPTYAFKATDGDLDLNCPTEMPLTDRREKELSDLGFVSLVHYKNTDHAVFFSGQTVQKPKEYDDNSATDNAKISARIPYILASSRIAHYLKVIGRDSVIGSFKEAADLEKFLNKWVKQYVTSDPSPSEEMKAKYPLAEASITVTPIAGEPGSYNAVAQLRPWLHVEELNASVRMVAKIEPKK